MTSSSPALPEARTATRAHPDATLMALAAVHGTVLVLWPSLPVVALGLWWNSNTISHNFIHRPFFQGRAGNALCSAYLTVLLGFPQALWQQRHLAHHAGTRARLALRPQLAVELALVVTLWSTLAVAAPVFLLTVYLPGFLCGQALCALHGHYEHRGGTTSNHGRLYNALFFNDGYHREHHAQPAAGWRDLPAVPVARGRVSRWPAVLRWLDACPVRLLCALERAVLARPRLQRFVLERHERAFRRLCPRLRGARRIAIVGGGLYPRTALVLQRLLPSAELVLIDARREHLATARAFLDGRIECLCARYDPRAHRGFDVLVIPLSYEGDRALVYRSPGAPLVVVHDWIWHPRGESAVVSPLLLKRLNLVSGPSEPDRGLPERHANAWPIPDDLEREPVHHHARSQKRAIRREGASP